MSVAEMKLAAINEIAKLNDENAVKEVLELLTRYSEKKNDNTLNLSQHYKDITTQYKNVLKKLAE